MSLKPVPQARKRVLLATISLLTLLPTTFYLQNRTPRCKSSLIITAPSHGYPWYTASLQTNDLLIYPNTTTTPNAAISSITSLHNRSIVVLPPLDNRFRTLLSAAKVHDIPVVVLRREVSGAFRSFLEEGGKMEWKEWEIWIEDFFNDVAKDVEEERVIADWLWFDNLIWRSVIWLHRNGCHVRNWKKG